MYKLFYLVDQEGPIDGEKELIGDFESLEEALDFADCEHYSVELDVLSGMSIVYIV